MPDNLCYIHSQNLKQYTRVLQKCDIFPAFLAHIEKTYYPVFLAHFLKRTFFPVFPAFPAPVVTLEKNCCMTF